MGKEHLLAILAVVVLAIASGSSLYVHATQTTTDIITINGQQYTIDQLFSITSPRSFADVEYYGIALDDLMENAGVLSPETHSYTFTGADGYQKTVTWENMKNGLLTHDQQTVFSDLPKAFRVKDVVLIEVS